MEACFSASLDVEEVLTGAADSDIISLLLVSSSPMILLTGESWIGF